MKAATTHAERHLALNFGNEPHFHQGLPEFARQLAGFIAHHARDLREHRGWHFHFYMPATAHGMFGDEVRYHATLRRLRQAHRGPVVFDVWHGLHQHLRFRPPVDSRCNLITLHDLNYVHVKTGLSLWRHRMRHRRCLFRADCIIAVSQHSRGDLLRHFPSAPPSLVIHNGVADLTEVAPVAVAELEGVPFFLHVSRMAPNKNVEALLRLAAEWPQQLLVLAGPANAHMRRHIAFCEAQRLRNVLFLPDVTENVKAWLYGHCQLFLFPSTIEGFGLPPIEAMYFGKPVVVARRTSLPEVCGDGAGYWDDFEPATMRSVIEKTLTRVRCDVGSAAAIRAHALRYRWHTAAARYLGLYARCMGKTRDAGGTFADGFQGAGCMSVWTRSQAWNAAILGRFGRLGGHTK